MKKTPLRRVSKKRAKELTQYFKLRKDFLEKNPVCQACDGEPANQIHHRNHREHGRLNDQKDWVAVGNYCHTWIHNHPEAARKEGWLL